MCIQLRVAIIYQYRIASQLWKWVFTSNFPKTSNCPYTVMYMCNCDIATCLSKTNLRAFWNLFLYRFLIFVLLLNTYKSSPSFNAQSCGPTYTLKYDRDQNMWLVLFLTKYTINCLVVTDKRNSAKTQDWRRSCHKRFEKDIDRSISSLTLSWMCIKALCL